MPWKDFRADVSGDLHQLASALQNALEDESFFRLKPSKILATLKKKTIDSSSRPLEIFRNLK